MTTSKICVSFEIKLTLRVHEANTKINFVEMSERRRRRRRNDYDDVASGVNYDVSSSSSWSKLEDHFETGSYVASSFVHILASEHNLVTFCY